MFNAVCRIVVRRNSVQLDSSLLRAGRGDAKWFRPFGLNRPILQINPVKVNALGERGIGPSLHASGVINTEYPGGFLDI